MGFIADDPGATSKISPAAIREAVLAATPADVDWAKEIALATAHLVDRLPETDDEEKETTTTLAILTAGVLFAMRHPHPEVVFGSNPTN